jgi:outer membrane immunogenic protein
MKALAVQAVAMTLLLTSAAVAADIPRPVPIKSPAPVVVAYNWTGCYVGAGGGYGMWNQKSQYIDNIDGALGLPNDNGGRGWFGTVQVGCDYQFGSNIVIGAFGDYDFSGIKGDMTVPAFVPAGIGEEKLRNSWAAGGRIGWLPFQQLLVFVSGGYTQAQFGQVDLNFATTGAPTTFSLAKHTYSGWFLGSGYEYGIGWLPGLFWKTEYRFADYSSDRSAIIVTATGASTGDFIDSHKYVQTIRSELVWRFNFGGPVVARY